VDTTQKVRCEARAKVIKALAHPTRLAVVDELADKGERSVSELAEWVAGEMSTVSRHLAVLKNAGILDDERRGNTVYYRLRVPCIVNFFGCVESVLKSNVQRQQAVC
jgi:DNA-binding transcriptional ArsR family regulator